MTLSKNNKFISYLIVLMSLFVIVLFTKDIIFSIQENLDLKENYTLQLESKKVKLTSLNNLKNQLNNSSEDIDKYLVNITEDELIDYVYWYIEESNWKEWIIKVKSISITDEQDTEYGFKETTFNLNLVMPNEERLIDILDFLTSSNSKYNFFINSFNYPYGDIKEDFTVTIPLKILHK